VTGFGRGNKLIVDDIAWVRLNIVSRTRLLALQSPVVASEARIYLRIKFQIHVRHSYRILKAFLLITPRNLDTVFIHDGQELKEGCKFSNLDVDFMFDGQELKEGFKFAKGGVCDVSLAQVITDACRPC